MNSSIYSMNHSPKTQEPEGRPLDFDNDLVALSGIYMNFTDREHAFNFAFSLMGKTYAEKCAAYVAALDELAAMWIAADDPRRSNIPSPVYDPRTLQQKDLDELSADEAQTRESVRP